MKKFALLALSFMLTNTYAFNCMGDCQLGKQTVDFVNSASNLTLNQTTVMGDVHVAGKLQATAVKLKNLAAAGKTDLDNTIVENDAKIAGKLTAHGSTFNGDVFLAAKASFSNSKLNKQLNTTGKTELINSRVRGKTKSAGVLVAKRSIFDSSVKLAGDNAIFSNTQLNSDLIVESKDKTPTIEMICGSTVKGQISFEGEPGIVKTEQTSKAKFKIKNGRLEKITEVTCSD